MSADVVLIETGKTDAEKAKEFRERMSAALKPALVVLDDARLEGFIMSFNIGTDAFGKSKVDALGIVKAY